jgi:PPOX class probable F420-dependent enzyme
MEQMTDKERISFLTEGTRTAKVATIRSDGRPHVAPVWFDVDTDGSIVFTTGAGTVKGKALRHDPRVSICVDDETPPFAFVVIEGRAVLSEDLDECLVWATRLGRRYMGPDAADSYGRRNAVPGELLVRVTPTQVVAQRDVAD